MACPGINQPPALHRNGVELAEKGALFGENREQPHRACSKQLNGKLAYLRLRCITSGDATRGTIMFKGLYKVEFKTPRRKGAGVVYAADGKLHGGSSAFAYVGSYTERQHDYGRRLQHAAHPRSQFSVGVWLR
jgi:hypothetical protein